MVDLFEKQDIIYNAKTKLYFEEVLSSYNNKNYRSSMVMLYSVVIYDIVAKLKELSDLYSQKWATKVLEEINKLRKDNPKSPDWEKVLIEKISKQDDFLSLSVIEAINHLREIRNQCAHPAIDNNDELFTPSRYEADALLNRMLNEILTIPAMFTGKITEYITEQISKIAGYADFKWKDKPTLSKSFNKYFTRMNDKVFTKVFKDMWRLTFYTANEDCDKNRFANLIFLDIMLSERPTLLIETVKKESDYFNKISSDPHINRYLTILIYRRNYLLSLLDDTTKTLIKNSKHELVDVELYAWFAFDSVEEYLDNLAAKKELQQYSDIIIDNYKNDPKFDNYREYFKNILIEIYTNSSDFNSADKNFREFIYPIKEDLTKSDVLKIIEKSEINSQLSKRYEYMLTDDRGSKLMEIVKNVGVCEEDIKDFKKFYQFYKGYSSDDTNKTVTIDEDEFPF